MNEKVKVLGIEINNYFVEESVAHLDQYLNNDNLDTIGIVSASLLMAAYESEELKAEVENLDMTIIGDREILEALGEENKKRYREVETHRFLDAFFVQTSLNENTIFLLVDMEHQIVQIEEYLQKNFGVARIVGAYAAETSKEDEDGIVNEINSISPDIIISVIGTPFQEKFIFNNRNKLNAKIWLGLGHHDKVRQTIGLKPSWLSKLVDKTLFKRMVSKYNSEKGE